MVRIPKRYGQSRVDECPFCGEHSIVKNSQGIPVCKVHKDSKMGDLRCQCGDLLEMRSGKYGMYFHCMRCGNINSKKAFELNRIVDVSKDI